MVLCLESLKTLIWFSSGAATVIQNVTFTESVGVFSSLLLDIHLKIGSVFFDLLAAVSCISVRSDISDLLLSASF